MSPQQLKMAKPADFDCNDSRVTDGFQSSSKERVTWDITQIPLHIMMKRKRVVFVAFAAAAVLSVLK